MAIIITHKLFVETDREDALLRFRLAASLANDASALWLAAGMKSCLQSGRQ